MLLNDVQLRAFLAASDERARQRALEDLVARIVRPVMARVLARVARGSAALRPQDAEDIAGVVMVRILEKLHGACFSEDEAVYRLDDYVARLTLNAVADHRRDQTPELRRLKRRIRHIAGAAPRLAIWDSRVGMVCGLASWRERTDFTTVVPPDAVTAPALTDRDSVAAAIEGLLARAGRPVPIDVITRALADRWNLPRGGPDPLGDTTADAAAAPGAAYEAREMLEIVWQEILTLPARQRAALLLNLRDASGRNAIMLFPLTGVASFSEIAAAIGLSEEELTGLWNRLPLQDNEVAATLALTRQQVINLRKSARARLQRRVAVREKGKR